MQDFHGYTVSISGVLLFVLLQGLCVGLSDTVMVLKVGSSLDLPVQYPTESELSVQWIFNGKTFAEYSTDQSYTLLESQFSGRLKEDNDRVGVTVQDLQPQDSGTFSVAAEDTETQLPTQTFKVYIQIPITAVQIEKTWRLSTNSCDVDVKCAALGAESVSYLWSGYKTGSGAQLQFSLSPAEGAVTLNCTAANNVSSSSATETLSCSIKHGVHVVLANQKTVIRARGSSLNFQPEYPDGTVSFAEWKFNGKKFADYTSNRNYSFPESQFSGRLKENHDKVGVTVQNLQPQDSGTFSVVADGTRGQPPTQTFKVYIEDPITAVQIEKNQTWRLSTNSCDVDVKCAALGAESVSYLWSGYRTGSGAQLQFSLSPAEGAVTLNCTAANNVSSSSATETLSCSSEHPRTGHHNRQYAVTVIEE
ncbi:T-lymphocyte surface antigen Ly-9-like [Ictalurus furcatus]|uniref:T-lymphocyte surface antigen Ly-9-like n=1 Tax=Ictalurus furcatus TaxID=66913 RepID=UPI00234FD9DF|nr:T-lymphocyte surface antigen Ly-9-like [Ictalurus furcatus]